MKHLLDEKEMFFQVLLFLDTGPLMIKPPSSHVDVIYNIATCLSQSQSLITGTCTTITLKTFWTVKLVNSFLVDEGGWVFES